MPRQVDIFDLDLFDQGAAVEAAPCQAYHVEPLISGMAEVRTTCRMCGCEIITFRDHARRLCGSCRVNKQLRKVRG